MMSLISDIFQTLEDLYNDALGVVLSTGAYIAGSRTHTDLDGLVDICGQMHGLVRRSLDTNNSFSRITSKNKTSTRLRVSCCEIRNEP